MAADNMFDTKSVTPSGIDAAKVSPCVECAFHREWSGPAPDRVPEGDALAEGS
jgi:hypothetical protein